MKYSFVILHYKNIQVTMACIKSILELYSNTNVIVVDNASCDGTSERLTEHYRECENVHIITLLKTRGFSYGNNIGCSYAISSFSPDFLIVCNSDTIFTDANMLAKISKLYSKTNFAVLGPNIIKKSNNEHQSPFRNNYMSVKETLKEIKYYRKKRFLFSTINRLNVEETYHLIVNNRIYRYIAGRIDKCRVSSQHIKMKCSNRQTNVCLYGACLIFSPQYISKHKKIFYPETNFYCEEDILLAKCISENLLVLYEPSLYVFHVGRASTYLKASSVQSEIGRLDNLINSRYTYIKYINKLGL